MLQRKRRNSPASTSQNKRPKTVEAATVEAATVAARVPSAIANLLMTQNGGRSSTFAVTGLPTRAVVSGKANNVAPTLKEEGMPPP